MQSKGGMDTPRPVYFLNPLKIHGVRAEIISVKPTAFPVFRAEG